MIEINNLTTNPIDENFLKKIAKFVLKEEKKGASYLSIALIGPGRMRKLNKRYLGKNRVTDVLAFPESKVPLEKFKIFPPQKVPPLGEIVICLREVKKNAKRFNSSFKEELARILIHGILHLLGYDHEKDKVAAKKMEEKQNYYLKHLISNI